MVIDDEMGHRLEVMVPFNGTKLKTDQRYKNKAEGSLSRYEKVLMGISFIFGVSGILFWWKGKKRFNSEKNFIK